MPFIFSFIGKGQNWTAGLHSELEHISHTKTDKRESVKQNERSVFSQKHIFTLAERKRQKRVEYLFLFGSVVMEAA